MARMKRGLFTYAIMEGIGYCTRTAMSMSDKIHTCIVIYFEKSVLNYFLCLIYDNSIKVIPCCERCAIYGKSQCHIIFQHAKGFALWTKT